MSSAGYSGTPLAKKLGFKEGSRVLLQGEVPADYVQALTPLPPGIAFATRLAGDVALVQLFTRSRSQLAERLAAYRGTLAPEAVVWVSWPKKSSGVASEITEDGVREVALPLGFVDVKVCAVDATWSGLKLVLRKALRG